MKNATYALRVKQRGALACFIACFIPCFVVGCSKTAESPVSAPTNAPTNPLTQAATHEPTRTLDLPVSGIEFQSAEIQALQTDEFANPGLLWVDTGTSLWAQAPAGGAQSCRDCHGPIETMRAAATRYPRYNKSTKTLQNLTQRIEHCRIQNQQQPPVAYESETLLALTAAVSHQSKDLPFEVDIAGNAAPFFADGKEYFYTRRGQMNLACHHCHEVNAGRLLRGEQLSQGHGNGYPTYRLQWQSLGSLHRRLRFCNQAIRAEPFDYGAPQYVNLELFLAWRAGSLVLETPAVRR